MKMHLGMVDVPYQHNPDALSTGDVAELLEDKFQVMQRFFDMNDKEIVADIEDGIAAAIENAFAGQKNPNLFDEAMGKTEKRFREYIDSESHGIRLKKHSKPKAGPRHKKQYKKVESTTAFVASGLYRLNFKAWIES